MNTKLVSVRRNGILPAATGATPVVDGYGPNKLPFKYEASGLTIALHLIPIALIGWAIFKIVK
jgi:hypothetical protein